MKCVVSLLSVIWMIFLLTGCTPLTKKVTDTTTPNKLAEVLVKSFVKGNEDLFAKDILFQVEDLEAMVVLLNEEGEVSVNPEIVGRHKKDRVKLLEDWRKIKSAAEKDGVLWKTSKYYGCRYKMRQEHSLLPVSMNFEVYFEVGGYFYRIDVGSIAYKDRYYVFDKISWLGEVARPDDVVLAEAGNKKQKK